MDLLMKNEWIYSMLFAPIAAQKTQIVSVGMIIKDNMKKFFAWLKGDIPQGERLAEIEALIALNCRNRRTAFSLRLASYNIFKDLMA